MHFVTTTAQLRVLLQAQRADGKSIALVPTMGNLHAGHLRLIEQARQRADWVVCSIFVNPMQFGPNEDLDAYPRTLEADRLALQQLQCDCLFHPGVRDIYPDGLQNQTVVKVPELGDYHCGSSRPGHFDGVATVVSKLFNLTQPDVALFGLKDYQQFLIISKMAADLLFPIRIEGVETVRESDGLAMSSRNNYLDAEQRRLAPMLYATLLAIRDRIVGGERDFRALEENARGRLADAGLRPDYIAICQGNSLRPAGAEDTFLAILAAAYLGTTRLIDNVRLTLQ